MIYSRMFLTVIREALESLNANYGRGRIVKCGLGLDGAGWFEYTIPFSHCSSSRPFRRTFRIYHRHGSPRVTVYALNHQRTVNL